MPLWVNSGEQVRASDTDGVQADVQNDHEGEPAPLPIDGVLDLHTFLPEDLGDLLPDYLDECRRRGILEVRIIHGKGIGNVERSVHSILPRLPAVISFADAAPLFGGTGATIVKLNRKRLLSLSVPLLLTLSR